MTQWPNNFAISSSGASVVLGLASALFPVSSGAITQQTTKASLVSGNAAYTITCNAPALGSIVVGGNVNSLTHNDTLEIQIQRTYEMLYSKQQQLDVDLTRIMYAQLTDLYAE
jgi:hypothetical protein